MTNLSPCCIAPGKDTNNTIPSIISTGTLAISQHHPSNQNDSSSSKRNHPQENAEIVIEEDWTSILNNTDGYASHEHQITFSLANNQRKMIIRCAESLTPLDMMNLVEGTHDPTGNRIWMGARLFVEAFATRSSSSSSSSSSDSEFDGSFVVEGTIAAATRCEVGTKAFRRKRIVELGCCTGASGLSLLLQPEGDDGCRPALVVFTDFDANVLELCKRNCNLNLDSGEAMIVAEEEDCSRQVVLDGTSLRYGICQLKWNDERPNHDKGDDSNKQRMEDSTNPNPLGIHSYDTVIATDVLYDISSLRPLMNTASNLLKPNGYFVLSHVPRTNIDDDDDDAVISSSTILENLIAKEATTVGFRDDVDIIRPADLVRRSTISTDCELDLKEMEEVGAAILVFRKKSV